MTRPADPRGASRRGSDNADLGYGNADTGKPRRLPYRRHREPAPDCGCHGYEVNGTMYTRCEQHALAVGIDRGPVLGQCVVCAVGSV